MRDRVDAFLFAAIVVKADRTTTTFKNLNASMRHHSSRSNSPSIRRPRLAHSATRSFALPSAAAAVNAVPVEKIMVPIWYTA